MWENISELHQNESSLPTCRDHPCLHPSILPSTHSFIPQVVTASWYVLGTGRGAGNTALSQPGHCSDSWIWQTIAAASICLASVESVALNQFSPKLLQEKCDAEYGGSQNSSVWTGKGRRGAGVRAAPFLKGPVPNHPSFSKPVLVTVSSSNTFWLDGLELRSLLKQN